MNKHNWTYKKLGEVCEINYGTRVVQEKDKGSTYYVYGGGGATFMVDSYNREDCFIVSRFAMSPKCTRFVKGKFFLNDSGLSVSTKIKELSQPFLDKVILANNDTIYSMGKGMAQRNLDIPSFRNLSIPVPPLSTQSRIVSELDLLQSLIDKQKAQLKELDTLAQSIFYDMFGDPVENEKGWEVKKLGEITVKYSDGPFGSNLKSEHYQQTGVRVIRLQNIGVNTFIDLDQAYISEDHYGTLSKYSCYPGDIVIGTLGEPNLRACLIPNTIQKAINKADCVLCRVRKDIISNTFLCMVLNEKGFVDTQCQSFSHGQTRTRISAGQLKKSLIPIPPLSLQQSFAQKIESIERQKELINQSIREARALFDSRMEYYFGV